MALELPAIGDVVAEKYRLERLLGRGGMGAVFEATHLVTGKRVAIKCQIPREGASADDVQRFLREARAVALVSHPNIVDVYDVGEVNGVFFLVMQYLDGRPLTAFLDHAALPIGAAVRTMLSAMRGVQAAHRRGIVHRDLKPDNIVLCHDDDGGAMEPKVLDFGIAKLQSLDDSLSPSLTQSGAVMGTPHYMSPEQAQDSRHVDERTDIYSLGVILYELLTGARPFEATSLTALLLLVARGQTQSVHAVRPAVPEKLSQLIARAMAVNPSERFADLASFMAALQPFASPAGLSARDVGEGRGAEQGVSQTPLAVPSSGVPTERRSRGRVALVLGLAVLTLGAWALWLRAGSQQFAQDGTAESPPTHAAAAPSPPPSAPPLASPAEVVKAEAAQPSWRAAAPTISPVPPPSATLLAARLQPTGGRAERRSSAGTHATPTTRTRASSVAAAPSSAAPTAPAAEAAPSPAPDRQGHGRLQVDLTKDQF